MGGIKMNKKQKLVSTTLSTVTALSSVGAISSLPNTVIKNVQALDEKYSRNNSTGTTNS